jgi:hypothetical protein
MGALVKLPDRTADDSIRWQLLRAFLNQPGVRVFRTLRTISVSFESDIAAEQFHKLLLSRRGRMK